MYADDKQLYISVTPHDHRTLWILSKGVLNILEWVGKENNFLVILQREVSYRSALKLDTLNL